MDTNMSCGCVGYGYVPRQKLNCVFDAQTALKQGSLFPELVLTIDEYGKVCKGGGMAE
ncbi:MAG: spore coat associated protein CotJA [Firmicutes bacterium]|nr:spore coat associated protein CotJA [Bacillota bacterium]